MEYKMSVFEVQVNIHYMMIAYSEGYTSKKKERRRRNEKAFFLSWKMIFLKLIVNILVLLYIFNSPFAFLQI